jgi:hypothetical protein
MVRFLSPFLSFKNSQLIRLIGSFKTSTPYVSRMTGTGADIHKIALALS